MFLEKDLTFDSVIWKQDKARGVERKCFVLISSCNRENAAVAE